MNKRDRSLFEWVFQVPMWVWSNKAVDLEKYILLRSSLNSEKQKWVKTVEVSVLMTVQQTEHVAIKGCVASGPVRPRNTQNAPNVGTPEVYEESLLHVENSIFYYMQAKLHYANVISCLYPVGRHVLIRFIEQKSAQYFYIATYY